MSTLRIGHALSVVAIAAVCATAAGCDHPAAMTTPSPLPSAPTTRTAPTIVSLTLSEPGTTEVNRDVTVRAEITDADTTVDKLLLQWSATAGQIAGSGPVVTWRLQGSTVRTPVDVTITLTVIEQFQTPEGPREIRASRDAPALRVHDTTTELSEMALRYLVSRFGESPLGPSECLANFSDRCAGKADEFDEIVAHRARYQNLAATAALGRVVVDPARGTAEVFAPCAFTSREIATGTVGTTSGDCFLTAIYEERRWWLCSSTLLNANRVLLSDR